MKSPWCDERARYIDSAYNFFEDTRTGMIDVLIQRLKKKESKLEEKKITGEEGSWRFSLREIADILKKAGLDNIFVLLEFQPSPHKNKRADVILAGYKDGLPSVVSIELKQWSRASWNAEEETVYNFGAQYNESEHPVYQARRYAKMIQQNIEDFHPENGARVDYLAFLHKAYFSDIQSLYEISPRYADRLFAGDNDQRIKLIRFLQQCFDNFDGRAVADKLQKGKFKDSKSFLNLVGSMFQDPETFALTDEQRNVVSEIQKTISEVTAPNADKDRAIIMVNGGPGSGKTFIAINLMARLANSEKQVHFATNSTALRESLKKQVKCDKDTKHVSEVITSARTYSNRGDKDKIDVLIVDEAQRLNHWNVRRGHNNSKDFQKYLEDNNITQLFELAKSTKVLVLMIDEKQQTTAKDFVTNAEIKIMADRIGAEMPEPFILTEQHRSGGCKQFETWVDKLVDAIPITWHDETYFTVSVADSPEHMEQLVRELNETLPEDLKNNFGTAPRILAGFCWPWSKTLENKDRFKSIEDVTPDVRIGDWARCWNLYSAIPPYPNTDLWAFDKNGAEQVGSIFSSQGFEFPYCGVIIGDDLVFDGEGAPLKVNPEASKYEALKKIAKDNPSALQRFRNGYRVLLTRGMKGIVLYSTDEATQSMLKSIVNPD